ncbi:MAG: cupin domain-containing protein [Moorea sp. SIO1F2]|uniref:cupin domain-containing protein n=1 Tax=unclassified Moorena TaxID=2683338 RepID=UPI0013BCB758|nr:MULTISPECIES: cupin domain-containing protein [unclassified Moorena]NEP26819.1 cupin domain-containing protein [Moorena sp. SIO3I6]NET83852.1 cupin domain-containing protein [Moorena sp. SIO1F2]
MNNMNQSELKLGLEKLKQDWEPKGFKCELYRTNSVEFWSNPGHKADEFIIMIEGELEVYFQGKTHHPSIGEFFKVPANTPHNTRMSGIMYWIYAFDWQWNEDGVGIEEGKIRSPKVKSV